MINKHSPVARRPAGYHTYVMEWEGRSIRWYIDGAKVFEIGDNGTYKWGSASAERDRRRTRVPEAVHRRQPDEAAHQPRRSVARAQVRPTVDAVVRLLRRRLRPRLLALSSLRTSANGRVPHGSPAVSLVPGTDCG